MIQTPKRIERHGDTVVPASKEVQDTEVIKQRVGIFLLYYLLEGATITPKYYVTLLRKVMQQMVSKHLEGNSSPHNATITHHKLAGLRSEVLKHPAYSNDLAPLDYSLFTALKKRWKESFFMQ
jgi:hypothetical protein